MELLGTLSIILSSLFFVAFVIVYLQEEKEQTMQLNQETIITEQREEIAKLKAEIKELKETISNLEKRVYNYGEPLMKEYQPYWRQP